MNKDKFITMLIRLKIPQKPRSRKDHHYEWAKKYLVNRFGYLTDDMYRWLAEYLGI